MYSGGGALSHQQALLNLFAFGASLRIARAIEMRLKSGGSAGFAGDRSLVVAAAHRTTIRR
jgi:hypothetical protein